MNRQFLQSQITEIEIKRNELEWLTPYLIQAEKIADFGCSFGAETVASMWLFQTREAVGLDIDAKSIHQAREDFKGLQDEAREAHDAMTYSWTAREDRLWWSKTSTFFTRKILEPDFSLEYLTCDITRRTELEDAYYDLAFCDHVLHHILFDDSRENAQRDTQVAINEMARVVKPGGTIAACELVQFNDEERLDFARLIKRAGLNRIFVQEEEFEGLDGNGWVGKFVFRKNVLNVRDGI